MPHLLKVRKLKLRLAAEDLPRRLDVSQQPAAEELDALLLGERALGNVACGLSSREARRTAGLGGEQSVADSSSGRLTIAA